MANLSLALLLFFLFIFCINIGTVEPSIARPRLSRARAFIEASCQTTLYPALCIKCLSPYANSIRNPQQLAQVAFAVSLYKARYTRSYMLKVAKELKAMKAREYPAVRDCSQQIDDSVNQLSQSIRELRRLDPMSKAGMPDGTLWHIDNVETWVSAALTDASICLDGFSGHRMSKTKATIKGKVLNVAQLTSNALALFHQYAARYQASATINP